MSARPVFDGSVTTILDRALFLDAATFDDVKRFFGKFRVVAEVPLATTLIPLQPVIAAWNAVSNDGEDYDKQSTQGLRFSLILLRLIVSDNTWNDYGIELMKETGSSGSTELISTESSTSSQSG